jgi:hypothetical protein
VCAPTRPEARVRGSGSLVGDETDETDETDQTDRTLVA